MKTVSNGRRPQKIKSVISQQQLIGSYSNIKLKMRGQNKNLTVVVMKTPSHGRQPHNIQIVISQQPLIGSS